uniref:T32-15-2 n=1 Tax=synthetic construct TaxID=32630 RepID=UPI0029529589|nr:Chain B, T32-15-2 [synthetic construct]8CWY_D Chain D, T32-15-2 [synthetic construct]8CWY_F Chain F, T32-15-2 [synthetic construct]8CWY_H Chain H, T32-15-2 [synthetic construct]8CWY_J Chain J, T32-15-2 [synthetic construct]8CWY_L Chain L, T32-15-2 [synthetic construct]8CWY_N Chain N, T32-15-2 [synthetic construct]8CWY_P Chain P, T32-15-2 [synthetic construct]8CWY_R Chain R, T32-15-2 [synthetic construct]8CWY_T Chain T, T32-15-2 [synthetic construct]8CWY_V Chain V, T32-15-2 [synthetic c
TRTEIIRELERSLREQEELAKRLMELLLKLLRLQMTGSSDEDVRRLMLRIIELVEEIEELAREQKYLVEELKRQ